MWPIWQIIAGDFSTQPGNFHQIRKPPPESAACILLHQLGPVPQGRQKKRRGGTWWICLKLMGLKKENYSTLW
jgi:hypothetical protein